METWATRFGNHLLATGHADETIRTYVRNVRHFVGWCLAHETRPEAISRRGVKLYLADLKERLGAATVPMRLSCVRAYFESLLDEEVIDRDPTARLRVKRPRLAPKPPRSAGELKRLLSACKTTRDRVMIIVTYAAALRVKELVGLRDQDINLKEGTLLIRGKGGKERIVAPGIEAMRALLPFMGQRDGVLWWTSRGTPVSLGRAKANMDRIRRRAGLESGCWHILRITAANDAARAGVRLEDIQEFLGHSSIETTKHYCGYTIQGRSLDQIRQLNLAARLTS